MDRSTGTGVVAYRHRHLDQTAVGQDIRRGTNREIPSAAGTAGSDKVQRAARISAAAFALALGQYGSGRHEGDQYKHSQSSHCETSLIF